MLVSKIYKRDIFVRFMVRIPCDAAKCRGMWQMADGNQQKGDQMVQQHDPDPDWYLSQ